VTAAHSEPEVDSIAAAVAQTWHAVTASAVSG